MTTETYYKATDILNQISDIEHKRDAVSNQRFEFAKDFPELTDSYKAQCLAILDAKKAELEVQPASL